MDYTNAYDDKAQATDDDGSRNFCFGNSKFLSAFTFLMAGHGRSVCASTMLRDPSYAREQLRLACTMDDQALQQLAVRMLIAVPRSPYNL